MKRVLSILQGLLTGVVIVFVLIVAASFFPIPGTVKLFTVRSGSMEPTIHTGSLIFVRAVAEYRVGDIITIDAKEDQKTITHRVVEVRKTEAGEVYLTKGDNNEEADQEQVVRENVIGKTIFTLPLLGFPVAYAQTKKGFLFLIALPALLIILDEAITIVREIRLIRERRKHGEPLANPLATNMTFSERVREQREPAPPIPSVVPPVRKRKIV